MRIGVVFPQTELGGDVGAVRAYGEAVEELGFTTSSPTTTSSAPIPRCTSVGPARTTCATTFHEPFVMFGYLAAVTTMELVTGIIILPQRQTALVAKQAAEVDLLTGGRFRLGVGFGLEPRRVRGARQALHRPRSAHERADRPAAPRCGPSRR